MCPALTPADGDGLLIAQVRHLESELSRVTLERREAEQAAADQRSRRRTLAWQTESLELRLQEDDPQQPYDAEARLAQLDQERTEASARCDADLAQMRQQLSRSVEVNAELRTRCRELEQEASRARVVAAASVLAANA